MGTGKKSTSATRDGKALVKICSCVCGGPGRSKGIWGRGWKSSIWAGCDASSPAPRLRAGRGQRGCYFCSKAAPQLPHMWSPTLCGTLLLPWLADHLSPHPGWSPRPAEGQSCCCGSAAPLKGPSRTMAALPGEQRGGKGPSELWAALALNSAL